MTIQTNKCKYLIALFSNQGALKCFCSAWSAFLQMFAMPHWQDSEPLEIPPGGDLCDLVTSDDLASVLCFLVLCLEYKKKCICFINHLPFMVPCIPPPLKAVTGSPRAQALTNFLTARKWDNKGSFILSSYTCNANCGWAYMSDATVIITLDTEWLPWAIYWPLRVFCTIYTLY